MSDPLPLKSLNHIAVATSRVRKSRAFYCGVLGLREIDRPNFNFDGAWLAGHGMVIHLIHNSDAGAGDHRLRSRVNHSPCTLVTSIPSNVGSRSTTSSTAAANLPTRESNRSTFSIPMATRSRSPAIRPT